tara:strand:+ start:14360 stop:14731 length:372 start_codon:yes stop_codon:yes gene_type:complete
MNNFHKEKNSMATLYIREFGFSNELSDQEARAELKFMTEKLLPAIQSSQGIKSAKLFSGAGGLRSQIRLLVDMDDAGCYEKMLSNPEIRILLARLYSAWDLRNATQDFLREITQDIIDAHSSR